MLGAVIARRVAEFTVIADGVQNSELSAVRMPNSVSIFPLGEIVPEPHKVVQRSIFLFYFHRISVRISLDRCHGEVPKWLKGTVC